MTVTELRRSLIIKINQTENCDILEEMYRLIINEETDNSDSVYKLSKEQMNAVEEAQEQFKNGEFLESEQADKEIEELI